MTTETWFSWPGDNKVPYAVHEVKRSLITDTWSYSNWSNDLIVWDGYMTTAAYFKSFENKPYKTRYDAISKMLSDNGRGKEWFVCASGEESAHLLETVELFPTDGMMEVLEAELQVTERVELHNGFTLVNCGWGGICVMVKMFTKKADGEYHVHNREDAKETAQARSSVIVTP